MVNIMYILPQLLKIVLWKQVSAIPPQIESFHSDYWFVMKIAKCVIFIHIRLHASLVLCFRYVKISYEFQIICFSRYCTRVLEWLTLGKKKKISCYPCCVMQYILHIQILCYVGEKRMFGFVDRSGELHQILKVLIKCIETGPQKVVKPVFAGKPI